MIILLSPAKSLDFKEAGPDKQVSKPEFVKEANSIAGIFRSFSASELSGLMKISSKLAYENHERYRQWKPGAGIPEAKQAMLAYSGDVYNGLQASKLDFDDLEWAQGHVRILSGLYGILRPLDLIMPYRLEFATKVSVGQYKDLYGYWQEPLNRSLQSLKKEEGSGILVNLASAEYYKAIDADGAGYRVITPVFKEYRNGELKFLSMFGKKARGMMARYAIRERVEDPERLKLFAEDGYSYDDLLSDEDVWVFTR